MKVFWEKLGMLGPIYKLVGHGLSDCDIAEKLNTTELNVQGCVAWLLHFFNFSRREELVLRASNAAESTKLATVAA
jgi:DNA-binding NarL/FixJ family response regulator